MTYYDSLIIDRAVQLQTRNIFKKEYQLRLNGSGFNHSVGYYLTFVNRKLYGSKL